MEEEKSMEAEADKLQSYALALLASLSAKQMEWLIHQAEALRLLGEQSDV